MQFRKQNAVQRTLDANLTGGSLNFTLNVLSFRRSKVPLRRFPSDVQNFQGHWEHLKDQVHVLSSNGCSDSGPCLSHSFCWRCYRRQEGTDHTRACSQTLDKEKSRDTDQGRPHTLQHLAEMGLKEGTLPILEQAPYGQLGSQVPRFSAGSSQVQLLSQHWKCLQTGGQDQRVQEGELGENYWSR